MDTVGSQDPPRRPGGAWPEEVRIKAANLFARGVTVPEISRNTGVPEGTLTRWRTEPDVQAIVSDFRAELMSSLTSGLLDVGQQAIGTLVTALLGEASAVQVRAAVAVLELVLKYRDATDLEERISRLEKAAEERAAGAGESS